MDSLWDWWDWMRFISMGTKIIIDGIFGIFGRSSLTSSGFQEWYERTKHLCIILNKSPMIHIFRENNTRVDGLSKKGLRLPFGKLQVSHYKDGHPTRFFDIPIPWGFQLWRTLATTSERYTSEPVFLYVYYGFYLCIYVSLFTSILTFCKRAWISSEPDSQASQKTIHLMIPDLFLMSSDHFWSLSNISGAFSYEMGSLSCFYLCVMLWPPASGISMVWDSDAFKLNCWLCYGQCHHWNSVFCSC